MLLPRGRTAVVALALTMLLGIPRAASADLIDWIWDLSGPQMWGVGWLHCEILPQGGPVECKVPWIPSLPVDRAVSIAVDSNVYFSSGKNSKSADYDKFKVWMLNVDPMLQTKSFPFLPPEVYHGIGASYNVFFGPDFNTFESVALKLRFIGVRIRRFDAAYTLRIYPKKFMPEQFGVPRKAPVGSGKDYAQSITITWR